VSGRVESHRRTFEFAGFVDLLWALSDHLNSPQVVEVDLSRPNFFGPSGVVPLVSLVDRYTFLGWDFHVYLPEAEHLRSYFERAGWTAGLAGTEPPDAHSELSFMPLQSFTGHEELNAQINEIVNVLSTVTKYEPGVLRAIEWTVNEIADNVLVHSGGATGWLQTISRPNKGHVEIVVADSGRGVRDSISEGFPDVESDQAALQLAIERGVTRNREIGQGNGLAGSLSIARAAHGWVNLMSGHGNVRLFNDGRLDELATAYFQGTMASITLPTEAPILVEDALWGYSPMSMFETRNLSDQDGIVFALREESSGFGNRASGEALATKLRNIMVEFPQESITIDFAGIDTTSASFLDEFLAKLVKSEGVASFFSRFQFQNMSDFVRRTADAVIEQRLGV
jgi:hypothetical protein